MSFLSAYKQTGVEGLRKSIDIDLQSDEEKANSVDDLTQLTREKSVRHDMEAQKVILERLYELGAYEEAQKICRKLLFQKPNDPDLQDYSTKIKAAVSTHAGHVPKKTLLEKNKEILLKIE